MLKKLSIALVILTMLLAGCSAAMPNRESVQTVYVEEPAMAPMAESESLGAGAYSDKGAFALDNAGTIPERLVIKNANLAISVEDPTISMETISKMAEAMGGFVVSADMYQQTLSNGVKVPQVTMTIRVPAEKLDEAMATIKAETDLPVISENISSQDVTADYTDLNSKLTNLEAAEKQLQEIMASANRTEDVLAVYSQLVSVREQIEVTKGQMLYYERSAALSAITAQLYANAATQPLTIGGWQPKGVAKEALQSLINALQSIGNFVIRAGILYIPVLAIIFVPIILVIWGIRKLVRKNRTAKNVPPPAPITPPEA
jgi:hypothetical protein